jgi:hypothetical protein
VAIAFSRLIHINDSIDSNNSNTNNNDNNNTNNTASCESISCAAFTMYKLATISMANADCC